jgi:hypothetical protein
MNKKKMAKYFFRQIKMKNLIIILTAILFLLPACKDDSTTPINDDDNLITNPSFETSSNIPDYKHWTGNAFLYDSNFNKIDPIIKDAPSGGGQWCVQISPLWFPEEGFTETSISGQTGTNIYELTCWLKTINWHGSMSLRQYRNGEMISEKEVTDTTSVWKLESLTDTLTVLATDLLKVHLSAGSTEIATGRVRFDNLILKKKK